MFWALPKQLCRRWGCGGQKNLSAKSTGAKKAITKYLFYVYRQKMYHMCPPINARNNTKDEMPFITVQKIICIASLHANCVCAVCCVRRFCFLSDPKGKGKSRRVTVDLETVNGILGMVGNATCGGLNGNLRNTFLLIFSQGPIFGQIFVCELWSTQPQPQPHR